MQPTSPAVGNATIHAKVFRIDWHRKPRIVPTALWLWLGKKRFGLAGHWEHLGAIASSEQGSVSMHRA